ncbi:MAG: DinB family protein [Ignavibacteria bacterium]|nr:DinB family protein [Ignavibacteria bacterium]
MSIPSPGEYPEYKFIYLNLLEDDDIVNILSRQSNELRDMLSNVPEEIADKSYAFGKWTLKEVIGHLLDNERVFIARALRIARGDKQRLPGYEPDDYIKNAKWFDRTLKSLLEEMLLLRAADILLIKSFDVNDLQRRGFVEDDEYTVNSILYVIAGHEKHHINFIKENYLK